MYVGCDQYREALSAELDGEATGVPEDALAAHLSECQDCRGWFGRAARITRLVRLAPAEPMPDLTPAVLAALPAIGPLRRKVLAAARATLVVVAFLQALLAWSGALTGQDDMVAGHVAREVGAWNLALAVAFLTVATRPRAADALLAPVGVFVAVIAVSAASDAVAGDLALGRLLGHLLVASGFALLVTVGRAAPPQPGTPDRSRPRGLPSSPETEPDDAEPMPDLVAGLRLAAGTPRVRATDDVAMQTGFAA
jgi:predicted anti-sigma-YlaC factor YlaD